MGEQTNGWLRWKKRSVIVGTIVGILAIYAGAPAIGIELPRFATFTEHKTLATEVGENTAARLKRKVDELQNEAWKIEDRIAKVGEKPALVKRHREYIRQRDEAEAKRITYLDGK